jgi:hypothetical protein
MTEEETYTDKTYENMRRKEGDVCIPLLFAGRGCLPAL